MGRRLEGEGRREEERYAHKKYKEEKAKKKLEEEGRVKGGNTKR
jgi:hypothetical protein